MAHASLWMDLKIVWMTVLMFVRGDRLDDAAIQHARDWLDQRNAAGTGNAAGESGTPADFVKQPGGLGNDSIPSRYSRASAA